jgi:uncharacterized protein (TIGR00269 family)
MKSTNNSTKNPNKEICERCGKKSTMFLSYGPHRFCDEHFNYFFENRFKKNIRREKMVEKGDKILIALSGGKDSTVLMFLLNKFYSKVANLEALVIDEGIKGYRKKAIATAKNNCKKLGIKMHLKDFSKEFHTTNDKIFEIISTKEKAMGSCAFCGSLRRNIMNRWAKKLGANKLATGHNLDDEAQSVLMNVMNNDFEKMKKSTEFVGEENGFVRRIKPLSNTPENEIIAYCAINKIQHYSDECCPYSSSAKRNFFREMLNKTENELPGTKHSIRAFFEKLKPFISKQEVSKKSKKTQKIILEKKANIKINFCENCGEPTSNSSENRICSACKLIEEIETETNQNTNKNNKKKNKQNNKIEVKSARTCYSTKNNL